MERPSPHYSCPLLLQSRIRRYDKPGRGGPTSRQAGSPGDCAISRRIAMNNAG